jgi:hypothetical protein
MSKKETKKLDLMFAGFEDQDASDDDVEMIQESKVERNQGSSSPDTTQKKKKKKKNKKGKLKREAEQEVNHLEAQINMDSSSKRVKQGVEEVKRDAKMDDGIESEEEKLIREGEKMEKMIEIEKQMNQIGYNEDDYEVAKYEYPNCIHEYVAPKVFVRPEYKRPT